MRNVVECVELVESAFGVSAIDSLKVCNRLLTNNNRKLRKQGIWDFNLLPMYTCPQRGKVCQKCYAKRGKFGAPNVRKRHARNTLATAQPWFVACICLQIREEGIKRVRIHASGDFYSQEYLEKWTEIARLIPKTRFYCYTKSLHLDWTAFCSLKNTKVIQSVGGALDELVDYSKPHAVVFESKEALVEAGYVDCSKNDLLASLTKTVKVGLIKH